MTSKPHTLTVDGRTMTASVEADMPLLWVLRDTLGIQGPKFGCGVAACGSCMVLIDGAPVRSCVVSVSEVSGPVTTIEGLTSGGTLHPVQQAWIAEGAPQCGYCQAGQIMSAAALLASTPNPDDEEIDAAMYSNICRCGTYNKIKAAIKTAAKKR